jgi:hypothetical protein
MREEAVVISFTELSQYLHSTSWVNYKKPTSVRTCPLEHKVEPDVSSIRSNGAAATMIFGL